MAYRTTREKFCRETRPGVFDLEAGSYAEDFRAVDDVSQIGAALTTFFPGIGL